MSVKVERSAQNPSWRWECYVSQARTLRLVGGGRCVDDSEKGSSIASLKLKVQPCTTNSKNPSRASGIAAQMKKKEEERQGEWVEWSGGKRIVRKGGVSLFGNREGGVGASYHAVGHAHQPKVCLTQDLNIIHFHQCES